MDTKERRILINTCFGHFLSHFNMLVFPAVVIPLTATLDMKMSEVLGISFWMYLLFGLTALPWGISADRWGAKPLMFVFYAGAGAAGLCSAIWIDSPLALACSLGAIGLFSGIYHPAGLGLISKEIKKVSIGMGYNGMFGNVGLATAPLLTGAVTWLWGPRAAYLVLGGLNFIGIVIMLIFPLKPGSRLEQADSGSDGHTVLPFVILLLAMMMGGIVYRGATVILPAYFGIRNQEIFQWINSIWHGGITENLLATAVTSFIYLVGMFGQYTGGRVAQKYSPQYCYLFFPAVTIPTAFVMAVLTDLPLVGVTVVYIFFLLGMQPIENTLVATYTPPRFHHSAYGSKFILTFGVGALAVKLVALIETCLGIEYIFPALGLVSILWVILGAVLIRKTA